MYKRQLLEVLKKWRCSRSAVGDDYDDALDDDGYSNGVGSDDDCADDDEYDDDDDENNNIFLKFLTLVI